MAVSIGYGSALKMTTGATSTTYSKIANVRTVTGPASEADEVECTNLSSTSRYREFISSMIDPGELTFDICYDPTSTGDAAYTTAIGQPSHVKLAEIHKAQTVVNWQLIISNSTDKYFSFPGYVRGYTPTFPTDDLVSADLTVRLTGEITWPVS